VLDPATNALRFHSGGQGPIFIFRAATSTWDRYRPTSFPLGAMPLSVLRPALLTRLLPGDVLVVVSDGIFEYENRAGEQFGEERVKRVFVANRAQPMSDLVAQLQQAVSAFADGSPQEDDMTAVLVKRSDARTARGRFDRTFDSIPGMVDFTAEAFSRLAIDGGLLPSIDLAVEELFTNMVKYGTGSNAPVHLALTAVDGGVELTLIDEDVDAFDVTQAAEVDIDAPIEQRTPGGLGLHLIRRMAESVQYEYAAESRQSRISVRFKATESAAPR